MSSMLDEIEDALNNHFSSLSGIESDLIAPHNVPFSPKGKDTYYKVQHFPNQMIIPHVDGSHEEYRGLYQVQVRSKLDIGTKTNIQECERIARHFKDGTEILTATGEVVDIYKPAKIPTGSRFKTYYEGSVTIPYRLTLETGE